MSLEEEQPGRPTLTSPVLDERCGALVKAQPLLVRFKRIDLWDEGGATAVNKRSGTSRSRLFTSTRSRRYELLGYTESVHRHHVSKTRPPSTLSLVVPIFITSRSVHLPLLRPPTVKFPEHSRKSYQLINEVPSFILSSFVTLLIRTPLLLSL